MTNNFIDKRGDLDVESVGPFDHYPVMVNGWSVPYLQARYREDGVTVTLDGRFGLDLPTELGGTVISFLADAIAIALGWSCHPRRDWEPPAGYQSPNGVPPFRSLPWFRMHGIGTEDDA